MFQQLGTKTIKIFMLLFVLSQIVACGQKGKLYLPEGEETSAISPVISNINLLV
jgi:predicted small lipoprotein YifL